MAFVNALRGDGVYRCLCDGCDVEIRVDDITAIVGHGTPCVMSRLVARTPS